MKKLSITLALLIAGARVGGFNDYDSLRAWLHPVAVHAGHPACDPNQPTRKPCNMNTCAQMGKDGKSNGHKCSSYCSKSCCSCGGTVCTPDYPGEGANPDEGSPE